MSQLFNSMDPSPFREKDLDRDADEFIESWAREYPLDAPVSLRVHLEEWPTEDPTALIGDAVHNYYASRAQLAELEFRRLMRDGRTSLVIGVLFLGVCLAVGRIATGHHSVWAGYVAEGLTIAGWVAMWHPMQIYLYGWWPVRRRQRNFARLATMPVEVVPTVKP